MNSEGVLKLRQAGEAVEIDPRKSKCRGDLEVCCKESVSDTKYNYRFAVDC